MAGIDTGFYTQANPQAGLQAMEMRNLGAQNQLLGIDVQQKHQDLVKQQVQYLSGGLGILAQKPDLSQGDMMNFAQNALKEGIISPQTYQTELANVQAAGNDPAKLQALATNYAQRALDAGSQFQSTFGAQATINTGPNTVVGTYSPIHGLTPQATVANGLSPGEAATPVTVTNPDGSKTTTTASQFAGAVNGLTGAPSANAPNPLTGAPPQSPAPTASPSALPGINAPSGQQQKMFDASTEQYQAAKQNDSNYTANLIPLQKMIELLPKTQTGLGAETTTNLAKVAQTFGINLPGTATQADYYSQLEKYANVLARSSGAAPNSDAQLLAAMSSNPNVTMNNAAAQDVAKTMLSLQRMQHAAITTAQAQGMDNSPQNYSTFASKWGAQQDPRAYGVDLMSPEAKAALRKELLAGTPAANAAKAKFLASLKTAAQAGVLGEGGSGQ